MHECKKIKHIFLAYMDECKKIKHVVFKNFFTIFEQIKRTILKKLSTRQKNTALEHGTYYNTSTPRINY